MKGPVTVAIAGKGSFTGRLQAAGAIGLGQPEYTQAAIIGLFGKMFGLEHLFYVFMGIGTGLAGLLQKVVAIPTPLLEVALVAFRHMILTRTVTMFFIASFMNSDAFMLMVNFDRIGVIDGLNSFADILERHTVMMPIFTQGDMIILLHLGLGAVLHDVLVKRQGLQQGFFFLGKPVMPAIGLSLCKILAC